MGGRHLSAHFDGVIGNPTPGHKVRWFVRFECLVFRFSKNTIRLAISGRRRVFFFVSYLLVHTATSKRQKTSFIYVYADSTFVFFFLFCVLSEQHLRVHRSYSRVAGSINKSKKYLDDDDLPASFYISPVDKKMDHNRASAASWRLRPQSFTNVSWNINEGKKLQASRCNKRCWRNRWGLRACKLKYTKPSKVEYDTRLAV